MIGSRSKKSHKEHKESSKAESRDNESLIAASVVRPESEPVAKKAKKSKKSKKMKREPSGEVSKENKKKRQATSDLVANTDDEESLAGSKSRKRMKIESVETKPVA